MTRLENEVETEALVTIEWIEKGVDETMKKTETDKEVKKESLAVSEARGIILVHVT